MVLDERRIGFGYREPDSRNRPVDARTYLLSLKSDFNIRRIYYPGCGDDRVLEKAFGVGEIVYVDKRERSLARNGRRLIIAHHDAYLLAMVFLTRSTTMIVMQIISNFWKCLEH